MTSHSQEIPHTKSTPNTTKSPQHKEKEHLYPEIPYSLPHKELNNFKRITRAYTRQIGSLPLALLLCQRKQIIRPIFDTHDEVFVHAVEDVIDFSLKEIEKTLNLVIETPSGNYSEPDEFQFEEEGSNSDHSGLELEDMEDNINNNG